MNPESRKGNISNFDVMENNENHLFENILRVLKENEKKNLKSRESVVHKMKVAVDDLIQNSENQKVILQIY